MRTKNVMRIQEQIQRLRTFLRRARSMVEKEVGQKVVELWLKGASAEEIYSVVSHIIRDVYGLDQAVAQKMAKKRVRGGGYESAKEEDDSGVNPGN